jgi:alkaline phosphatase D
MRFSLGRIYLLLGTIVLLGISCVPNNNDTSSFKSDFQNNTQRVWIGPEYWANPLQDWQLSNGRLECLVSNENRNVYLLTRQIGKQKGHFRMSVDLGLLNTAISNNNANWVGLRLGTTGEFNDYRDNAVFGKGLNVGITTNGSLFIGEPGKNGNNREIIDALKKGVKLVVEARPYEENYNLSLHFSDAETGELMAKIGKRNISEEELSGGVALVSNFTDKPSGEVNYQKSVWFSRWNLSGSKLSVHDDNAFGPILFSQYTLSRGILKMTAQMAPVDEPGKKVALQIKKKEEWQTIAKAPVDKDARTATFRIERWNGTEDTPYRLVYALGMGNGKSKNFYWKGLIRKEPLNKEEVVVAGFTGNNDLGFPNNDIVEQVKYQNPDLLFFSGDQIYETVGGYGFRREPHNIACLDYLRKWYLYGWAYRDLMKDRPTVSIPDDHDMYMGNIWGEGGKATIKNGSKTEIQDDGGYQMPARWVRMVERTQTSHLPDPYDATPVKQGISVYYTEMNYGGISFAIIEDRKFKSAPKALLPKANIINGWPQNKSFDVVKEADVPKATLLGERQLKFLEDWAGDWSNGTWMKVLFSQTIFANVATLPEESMSDKIVPELRILHEGEYPENDRQASDMDSNGWPQTGRGKALKIIRKGFAFHLAGDQHLGSTIQYGVDEWGDGGFAFCVPSISNYWPRRWYPSMGGKNHLPGAPKYTGDFTDGFGNKITVHAVSNPLFTNKTPSNLYDRATGYGITRFNRKTRDITMECWPRNADPSRGNSGQYAGWPVTINQRDNYASEGEVFLPRIKVENLQDPVIQVIDERNKEVVSTLRIEGNAYQPKVFRKGSYTIKVFDSDKSKISVLNEVSTVEDADKQLYVKF